MKFRKKPVEIDAWPIKELVILWQELRMLPAEITSKQTDGTLRFVTNGVYVKTLEGTVFGTTEAVLIRGVEGEFYPCKLDIFKATYERVEEGNGLLRGTTRDQDGAENAPLGVER